LLVNLFTANLSAQYIFSGTVNDVGEVESGELDAGICLSPDLDAFWFGPSQIPILGTSGTSGNLYDLSGATININTHSAASMVAAVFTTDGMQGSEFRLGEIKIEDDQAYDLFGFFYFGMGEDFNATITNGNIKVVNTVGNAYGALFNMPGAAYNLGENANVTFGTINVTAFLDAWGLDFDTIEGQLSVNNVHVVSEEGNAIGVHIGEITGEKSKVTIGTVFVESNGGVAHGVEIGLGEFTLTGNITAKVSENGIEAFGVKAGNLDEEGELIIHIANNIVVRAECGNDIGTGFRIYTTDTTINLHNNSLVTCSVGVGEGGTLTIIGSGSANLGIVTMNNNDLTIGNGTDSPTIALNVQESTLDGTNILNKGATLAVYGEMSLDDIADDGKNPLQNVAAFNVGMEDDPTKGLRSTATFTNYYFEGNETAGWQIYAENREVASMSDGFLVALTMHNRYAAWHAVRNQLISSHGFGNRSGYRGQFCDPCGSVQSSPCGMGSFNGSLARSAWVNYTGRSDRFQSSYEFNENWRLSMEGVQAGTDLFRSQQSQFGLLFGYEGGKITSYNPLNVDKDRLNVQDLYFGFYGARVFRDGTDVRGIFAYGRQDFDMIRRHDPDGSNIYTTSFKGHTSEINLEVGRRVASGQWSLRPLVALDIFNSNIRGAEEAGVGGNAVRYNKAHLTQVFFRTGAEARLQRRNFTFDSGVYIAYDVNGQQLRTHVTGIGEDNAERNASLAGAKLGNTLLTFNLGGTYQIGKSCSIFGGYLGESVTDRANSRVHSQGHVGLGYVW